MEKNKKTIVKKKDKEISMNKYSYIFYIYIKIRL